MTQIKKKRKDKESLVLNNNLFNHEENKKIKLAYGRLHIHISAFDDFAEFESYFNDIKKTQDDKELNKWLLKVLFLKLKEDKKKKIMDAALKEFSGSSFDTASINQIVKESDIAKGSFFTVFMVISN